MAPRHFQHSCYFKIAPCKPHPNHSHLCLCSTHWISFAVSNLDPSIWISFWESGWSSGELNLASSAGDEQQLPWSCPNLWFSSDGSSPEMQKKITLRRSLIMFKSFMAFYFYVQDQGTFWMHFALAFSWILLSHVTSHCWVQRIKSFQYSECFLHLDYLWNSDLWHLNWKLFN